VSECACVCACYPIIKGTIWHIPVQERVADSVNLCPLAQQGAANAIKHQPDLRADFVFSLRRSTLRVKKLGGVGKTRRTG
jgi:hypothetical protein